MGISIIDFEETYELAKGSVSLGGINMTWDFTDGLSKEEWMKRERIRSGIEPIIKDDGRILMPKLGII